MPTLWNDYLSFLDVDHLNVRHLEQTPWRVSLMRGVRMLQVEWCSNYCTNIGLLDTQNKHFIEMLKLLFGLQQNKSAPGLLRRIFYETINHLREHFREEEHFYKVYAPHDLEEHRNQHQLFLETMEHLGYDAFEEGTEASRAMCEYLRNWMIFHILHFDKNTAYDIKRAMRN